MPPDNAPDNIYFGAVEINGAGIRFYGDVCLVLKEGAVTQETTILRSKFLRFGPLTDPGTHRSTKRGYDSRRGIAC